MDYRLLLFDRDGTLTYEDRNYHRDLTMVKAYPFAGPILLSLQAKGYRLGVVTNQSGISRGYWSLEEVDALHNRLAEEWSTAITWHVCPHHANEDCPCRKPKPAMINDAISAADVPLDEVLMVGDSRADAGAAEAAGVDFALVLTGRGRDTQKTLTATGVVLETVADLEGHLG